MICKKCSKEKRPRPNADGTMPEGHALNLPDGYEINLDVWDGGGPSFDEVPDSVDALRYSVSFTPEEISGRASVTPEQDESYNRHIFHVTMPDGRILNRGPINFMYEGSDPDDTIPLYRTEVSAYTDIDRIPCGIDFRSSLRRYFNERIASNPYWRRAGGSLLDQGEIGRFEGVRFHERRPRRNLDFNFRNAATELGQTDRYYSYVGPAGERRDLVISSNDDSYRVMPPNHRQWPEPPGLNGQGHISIVGSGRIIFLSDLMIQMPAGLFYYDTYEDREGCKFINIKRVSEVDRTSNRWHHIAEGVSELLPLEENDWN